MLPASSYSGIAIVSILQGVELSGNSCLQGLVLPQAFLGKSNSIEENSYLHPFRGSNLDLVFRFLIGKALHPLFLLAGYPKATDRSLEQKNASLSEACVALYSGSSGI